MISYIGAKTGSLGKHIEQYIPRDIETYCEPFSGMFNVYYQMDLDQYTNLKDVVYNDFNPLNANIFAAVRQYDKFYPHLANQPYQERYVDDTDPKYAKWFYEYQAEIFNKDLELDTDNPDFDVAMKYAYVLGQVFSGSKPEKAKFIDLKGKYNCKFGAFSRKLNFTNHGKSLKKHFDNITHVECMDFEELMKKYDNPMAYFYLDPPYFTKETYYSNHEFGLHTHERLADCMKSLKSRWSLSYYYFDELEQFFPKDQYRWVEKEFHKISGAKKGQPVNKSTEVLIMNY
jgi:DNA adenine methylase